MKLKKCILDCIIRNIIHSEIHFLVLNFKIYNRFLDCAIDFWIVKKKNATSEFLTFKLYIPKTCWIINLKKIWITNSKYFE